MIVSKNKGGMVGITFLGQKNMGKYLERIVVGVWRIVQGNPGGGSSAQVGSAPGISPHFAFNAY